MARRGLCKILGETRSCKETYRRTKQKKGTHPIAPYEEGRVFVGYYTSLPRSAGASEERGSTNPAVVKEDAEGYSTH